MKVLHIITALNYGGAEAMLAKLLATYRHDPQQPRQRVLSLVTPGPVGRQMLADGIDVTSLDMHHGWQAPLVLTALYRHVRRYDPDIIQGWMYHGNIAASVAARMARRRVPLLWNVRHSLSDIARERWTSRLFIRLGARLSNAPDAILYNSRAALHQHKAIGYAGRAALVIPNGFDLDRFRPDDEARPARTRLCAMFGIDPAAIVVGMIARLHPMKDHATIIEAAERARARGHDIHLILAGCGTESLKGALPANRLTLLGDRRDVPDWLPGLDIVTLSSAWGEGFPNILGEAMAAGVPCVATDVGDSAEILGDGGLCVAPGDPTALADALATLCAAGPVGRPAIGRRGRTRVATTYALPMIARRYADLYAQTYARANSGKSPTPGTPQCVG